MHICIDFAWLGSVLFCSHQCFFRLAELKFQNELSACLLLSLGLKFIVLLVLNVNRIVLAAFSMTIKSQYVKTTTYVKRVLESYRTGKVSVLLALARKIL